MPAAALPEAITTPLPPSGRLSGSGNEDHGTLIQNDAFRKLSPASSPYNYILGRKGTGKTRLLRALAERNLGEPLLVADDYPHPHGLKSGDALLLDLSRKVQGEPTLYWWAILDASLASSRREDQQFMLSEILASLEQGADLDVSSIKDRILRLPAKKIFLIDGVETAFVASRIRPFIEGLFRFLSTVQHDVEISQKLTVRLFLRTDLALSASQNIEQQLEQRTLRLSWNTETILNFVLSRISRLDWFKTNFETAINKIDAQLSRIAHGDLDEESCMEILRMIFPEQMRRHNLLIRTFLTAYFSDGQGESASFYPRVYDSFLRFIAERGELKEGLVSQDLIAEAHTEACKAYLQQVKAELEFLIELSEDQSENRDRISTLLDQFRGRKTPFSFEKTLEEITLETGFLRAELQKALNQMKKVGVFEDRPGFRGQWRAGRLFKTSLEMIYNRGRRDPGSLISEDTD